jgi:hypothetical protein
MIDGIDLRSLDMKTIDDDVDECTGIETMEGSLPMTLRVLKSWIHPSGVIAIGMIASASRELEAEHTTVQGARSLK